MSEAAETDAWRSYLRAERREAVRELAAAYPERRSLPVDVVDLHDHDPDLTAALFADPDRALAGADRALRACHESFDRVHVRVRNNPGLLGLASLRAEHVGDLVTVEARVEAAGPLRATLAEAVYECRACGARATVAPTGVADPAPARCGDCGEADPALRRSESTFVDLRRVTLTPPGDDADRRLDARLRDDLADALAPGDTALVTGVVRAERIGDANRFAPALDANAVATERRADRQPDLKETIRSQWERAVDRR